MTDEARRGFAPATDEGIDRVLREVRGEQDAGELVQLALYARPKDAPDYFVVRAWFIGPGQLRLGPGAGFRRLEDALQWIEQEFPQLMRFERAEADEPHIVATWM